MLKKIIVKNFMNFKEELVFDLGAGNYEYNNDSVNKSIIKNSFVYGKNGSGKSNLGKAIMDVTTHLTDNEYDDNHYQHYTNLDNIEDKASFSYFFDFQDRELEYHYQKSSVRDVFNEKIIIDDELVIDSEHRYINLAGAETLNIDYDQTNISFVKYIYRNTIMDIKNPNVRTFLEFQHFVNKMLSFNSLDGNNYQGYKKGSDNLSDIIINANKLQEFQAFLAEAEIEYELRHRIINDKNHIVVVFETGKEVDIFSVASKGTRALILFYTWLLEFNSVSLVVMDEFDSYYHNDLTRFVIKKVKETTVQSVFSSHNTSVMTNEIGRPDGYYILQNNEVFSLDKLTDKELRKAHNIEKMYRAKAFEKDE